MSQKKTTCTPLVNADSSYTKSYRLFKDFLDNNYTALDAMAEVEQAYHGGKSLRIAEVHENLGRLLTAVKDMGKTMQALAGDAYAPLQRVVEGISREVLADLLPVAEMRKDLVLPLQSISREMISFVGAKAANMGFMASELELPVPGGFAVTAEAFRMVLREGNLQKIVDQELAGLDPGSSESLARVSQTLQKAILEATLPDTLADAVVQAFTDLEQDLGHGVQVAVRSSAVGEDGEISFAGQYASVLGVDRDHVLDAYKQVLASKYSPRAMSYRLQNRLDDAETPMCVLVVAMVDARSSGVIYSMNPSGIAEDDSSAQSPESDPQLVMVSAVWGLGESLVSGEQSPDVYLVRKNDFSVIHREISRKEKKLVLLADGGTGLEDVAQDLQDAPALEEARVRKLARYAVQLEEFFQAPQDIEWAVDQEGKVLLLQTRPLKIVESGKAQKSDIDNTRHPVLLSTGKTASVGIAAGEAFVVNRAQDAEHIPENAILVTRTTSPEYARHLHRVQGLITDMGGVSSHLASVAREQGIPAIVDAREATSRIESGQEVTMDAGTATVYQGRIQDWVDNMSASQSRKAMHGPMHRRVGKILEKITPLNLTDPQSEAFAPENCRTIHDVIRYLHEKSITEMFAISAPHGEGEGHASVELVSDIPLRIRLIDLGGGLREGLTDCDQATPEDIRSVPLRSLWHGLTHPGLNWSSTVDLSLRNLAGLMTTGSMEDARQVVGQQSYALVAADYLNLNAKFGYHYANLDVLCADEGAQNYITFQFAGGAGSYYGKSLRILLLAEILENLEFSTELKGDFLSASLKGFDAPMLREKLDQMGRLMACSRLLDVALKDESDVERLAKMFFAGEYDFLARKDENAVRDFYVHEGHWTRVQEDGQVICRQVGTRIVDPVSAGLACLLGRVTGSGYHSFLETIKAYSYFPLAIAKDSRFSDGVLEVSARCESGCIDMAAGVVFGLRNAGNYHVFRIDALKNSAVFFQFTKGRHEEQAKVEMELNPDQWYRLTLKVRQDVVTAAVDGRTVLEYRAPETIQGYSGLWSKADSVVSFKDMRLRTDEEELKFAF